jgi:putative DNA primase/helicase
MTLQQICNDQFMVNKLAGKVANICSELPRGKINDPDLFKSLTGGDPVHGRIFYGTGSKFINTAKFLFACNEVPYVPEADAAYKERFIVISFNRIYEPGAPGTIANFSDLLVGELSGILNLAIIGRLELLANNGFAIDPHCVSFRNDYDTYTGSSVLPFAAACLFVGPDFHAAKSTVYHYYEKYCAHQRVDVLTESAFWLELKKALKKEKIKESRPRGVAPKLDDDMEQGVDLGDGGANSRYIDIKGIGINQNFLAGL